MNFDPLTKKKLFHGKMQPPSEQEVTTVPEFTITYGTVCEVCNIFALVLFSMPSLLMSIDILSSLDD